METSVGLKLIMHYHVICNRKNATKQNDHSFSVSLWGKLTCNSSTRLAYWQQDNPALIGCKAVKSMKYIFICLLWLKLSSFQISL